MKKENYIAKQDVEIILQLYNQFGGDTSEVVSPLAGAGSNRRYYRIFGSPSVIGVVGTSSDENRAFIALSRHMRSQGIHVPQVLTMSDDNMCYLQEDLGSTSLYDYIETCHKRGGVWDEETISLLHQVMRDLPHIQFLTARDFDFTTCAHQGGFDLRSIGWDLNYFKYCFLKTTGIDFSEHRLEDDFSRLAVDLLTESENGLPRGMETFMYRDFQSRNVMIGRRGNDIMPYYIDFQGGRKGPIHYDVVSFLWQSRAAYPEELRQQLLDTYLKTLKTYVPVDEGPFRARLMLFALFRIMQVLGAYGFRGCFERKAIFVVSIPGAIAQLRELLHIHDFSRYPYLIQLLTEMVSLPRYNAETQNFCNPKLTVTIRSFSYKKGIPEDYSGNGGGYVFDCRYIHNPGRYEPYKRLTGLDLPVINFLENNGEILSFLDHVYRLVESTVEKYVERGFSSLEVCFGCTGGQHRSVYSAQHLAEFLTDKYSGVIRIQLIHRELGVQQLFE